MEKEINGNHDGAVTELDGDLLDIAPKCYGIAEFVSKCETPMTIAVQGDWGTGKTTSMNIIRQILREKSMKRAASEPQQQNSDRVQKNSGLGIFRKDTETTELKPTADSDYTVWFNTWEFSVIDGKSGNLNLFMCLMSMIVKQIKEQFTEKKDYNSHYVEKFTSAACTVLDVMLKNNLFDTVKDGFGAMSGGSSTDDKKNAENFIEEVGALKSRVQDIISVIATGMTCEEKDELIKSMSSPKNISPETQQKIDRMNNPRRLYFFIDDLDRLEPATAVGLLECIKNYLDLENCVFILAIDREVVDRGLKDKYGADFSNRKARQFFDKIIQIPYELPVNNYDTEKYIKNLCPGEEETVYKNYVGLLRSMGVYNPRTIKRVFNLMKLQECMAERNMAEINNNRLSFFALVLLQIEDIEEFKYFNTKLESKEYAYDAYIKERRSLKNSFFRYLEDEIEYTDEEISAYTDEELIETVCSELKQEKNDLTDEVIENKVKKLRRRIANIKRLKNIAKLMNTYSEEELRVMRIKAFPDNICKYIKSLNRHWSIRNENDGETTQIIFAENGTVYTTVWYENPDNISISVHYKETEAYDSGKKVIGSFKSADEIEYYTADDADGNKCIIIEGISAEMKYNIFELLKILLENFIKAE